MPRPFDEVEFAAVSVITTGVQRTDRVVELAVARFSGDGRQAAQWSTLVDPGDELGDVGARRERLDPADVRRAPKFPEVIGDLIEQLKGAVFVGHNAEFDLRFLRYEFARLDLALPKLPTLCTLSLGCFLGAPSRRLSKCCQHFGIPWSESRSALPQAKATARLLAVYLTALKVKQITTLEELDVTRPIPAASDWPSKRPTGRRFDREEVQERVGEPTHYLTKLAERVPASDDKAETRYLDLLDRALEDLARGLRDVASVRELAGEAGLEAEEVAVVHKRYVKDLVRAAAEDGAISSGERQEIDLLAGLLGVDVTQVDAWIAQVLDDQP